MFHEFLVTWRGFPSWRGHLETLLRYGCGYSGDGGEVHGVLKTIQTRSTTCDIFQMSRGEVLSVAKDEICHAVLRMRLLSISCAESCVVISCGKVDYDKSG
jgi:hypothetical protein